MRLVQRVHDRLEHLADVGANVDQGEAGAVAPGQLTGELGLIDGCRT
jgi:hypothetical protein